MTESELRTLVEASREEGFRALFQQYKGYVYTIVWDKLCGTGSREDADECVSDIFADIFLHFDEIHEGTLRGYIGTLARRTAIDAFRRLSARGMTISADEEQFKEIPSEADLEEDYEASALRQILLDKIRSLGEPDATIIMLKYYYDRKSDEIAKAVKLRPAAVRMRLSRAMKRLRKLLDADGISL